jgi:hypothetical protein
MQEVKGPDFVPTLFTHAAIGFFRHRPFRKTSAREVLALGRFGLRERNHRNHPASM